jgi:hypothetical protein
MNMRTVLCILIMLVALPAFPQANAQKISQWLVLGPAEILADGQALPAGEEAALEYDFLSIARLHPEAGLKVQWGTQRQLTWRPETARFTGSAGKQAVYLAVYLESQRWLQAELAIEAPFPVRVFFDGAAPWPAANTCCWSKGFCPPKGTPLRRQPPLRTRPCNCRPA